MLVGLWCHRLIVSLFNRKPEACASPVFAHASGLRLNKHADISNRPRYDSFQIAITKSLP